MQVHRRRSGARMAAEEQWLPRYEIVTLGSLCTADWAIHI